MSYGKIVHCEGQRFKIIQSKVNLKTVLYPTRHLIVISKGVVSTM